MAETESPLDLIWEVSAISKVIGRTERQTFGMLEKGLLPARKVGGRWVAERGQLLRFFLDQEAA